MGNAAGVRRDFGELEQRRMKAASLFQRGVSQAEVARRPVIGKPLGAAVKGLGPGRTEKGRPGGPQAAAAGGRAGSGGNGAQAWAARAGLRGQSVDRAAGRSLDRRAVWSALPSRARLENPGAARLELPAPGGPRARARRESDQARKTVPRPAAKKKPRQSGRTIVFIDESGLS